MQVARLLLDQSDIVFGRTFRRLAGLTDEELLWEPAPRCWSVRERPDGAVRADWAPYIGGAERTGGDAAHPPPFTNLAWRIWHLTDVYGRTQNAALLIGSVRSTDPAADRPVPQRSAADATRSLSDAHDRWRRVLASMSDADLEQPIAGRRHRGMPKVGYVMAMIDEFCHHGAELGALRDLYAHVHRPDPASAERPNLAEVGWAGMWHLVPALIEQGCDVNAESGGATVLHLACAAGERGVVELLLDRGADPDARHCVAVVWGGAGRSGDRDTPIDWAEHFAHHDIVDLLRKRLDDARRK